MTHKQLQPDSCIIWLLREIIRAVTIIALGATIGLGMYYLFMELL